ncbi:MAG: hypothetical protein MSC30_16405 [Gaiellaceae bacterium MAG52_C11]|nr:hypothetical protein [Candidatus Gaiellasilicea maunaloa]
MSRSRRGAPPPLPERPYRDSLLLNLALAIVILVVARLTDGDFGRAIAFAIGYFVLATAWSWWRFRQRLADEGGERS